MQNKHEKICFCSSFYESGRKFIPDYFKSLQDTVADFGKDVYLCVALDDLQSPLATLSKYEKDIDIRVSFGSRSESISAIRSRMIEHAILSGADVLIFIDMDDCASKFCISEHLNALGDADISFGDMQLVNQRNQSMKMNLFDGYEVPEKIKSVSDISRGNCLGFSNTAIKTNKIKLADCVIPSHLVASDWWFFRNLISRGFSARKTGRIVAHYRQHDDNILGALPAVSVDALEAKCRILIDHLESFSSCDEDLQWIEKAKRLSDLCSQNPQYINDLLDENGGGGMVWFGDVFKIASLIDDHLV